MKFPTVVPSFKLAGIAAAIALVAGGLGGLKLGAWMQQGKELRAARSQIAALQVQHQHEIDFIQNRLTTVREASDGYQRELQALRAEPAVDTPVRLCVQPRTRLPEAPSHPTQPGPDAGTPAAGILQPPTGSHLEAGDDIGPNLRSLARQADAILAQARGLQAASR